MLCGRPSSGRIHRMMSPLKHAGSSSLTFRSVRRRYPAASTGRAILGLTRGRALSRRGSLIRSMASERVRIDVTDHVAIVTLTRPDKHNALDAEMFDAIIEAGERVTNEPGVRAVVVHGE